ncbi:MAG: S26 family signal peptidase [Spirochaetes bacterium]|nr:S26 family signal peptidase [Spirochaetota bacterium]
MSLFSRHRSFAEKVLSARKRRRTAGRVLAILLIAAASQTFLLRAYRVSTNTMIPGLEKGDIVLSAPLLGGIATIFGTLPSLLPLARGSLVVVLPETPHAQGLIQKAWDSLVRFLSFQRFSPLAARTGEEPATPGLYRILGLPGDRLRRRGPIYEIEAEGKASFSTEYLAAEREYSISGLPRSTSASEDAAVEGQELSLGKGQYFVACDDRSAFAGSPLWGPIGADRFGGRLVLVFWPLKRAKFL